MSLTKNENTVNLTSASLVVIMLLHEGFDSYTLKKKKSLAAFWREFRFKCACVMACPMILGDVIFCGAVIFKMEAQNVICLLKQMFLPHNSHILHSSYLISVAVSPPMSY